RVCAHASVARPNLATTASPHSANVARFAATVRMTRKLIQGSSVTGAGLRKRWSSRAVGARTDQVEAVLTRSESDLARGLDRTFDALGRGEIFDAAAVRAHEVMVVAGEILGELVAREFVVRDDAVH